MDLQALREIDLFARLDAVQVAHIASTGSERTLRRGELVFDEDDPAQDFFVIYRGRVRISKAVPGMGEEALAVLDQGSYFGEMELVNPGEPRVARATAHEDCILQVFPYVDLHAALGTDLELAVALLWSFVGTLSERLKNTDNKVAATFAMAQFS